MLQLFQSLKFQVICGAFLSIFLIASLSSYFLYQTHTEQLLRTAQGDLEVFHRLFSEQVSLRTKDLRLAIEVLLSDEAIVEHFRGRDRQALLAELGSLFENRLKPEYDITQLHFHLPPATSFLRLHRPENFGDDLSEWRPSLIRANTAVRPVAGIEVTRSGPGLKVVYPVIADGEHVGSVELASQITTLLATVAASVDVDYAISVHGPVWRQARCQDLLEARVEKDGTVYYQFSNEDLKKLLDSAPEVPQELQVIRLESRTRAVASFPLQDFTGQSVGFITVARDVTDAVAMFRSDLVKTESMVASLALLVAVLLYFSLDAYLFRPLEKSVKFAEEVEAGNLPSELELGRRGAAGMASTNEIDRLLSSLGRMMGYLRQMAQVAVSIAEGNLGVSVQPTSASDAFGRAFRRMTQNLRETISKVQQAADMVTACAGQIGTSADNIARGTHDQVSAAEETAATIGEMAQQIETLSKSAQDVAQTMNQTSTSISGISRSIEGVATESEEVLASVDETTATMTAMSSSLKTLAERVKVVDQAARQATRDATDGGAELNQVLLGIGNSSRDIAGIVGLIDEVADQTNLLAFNAAIQAAHAGEAGKGFAVVAGEIKGLAERSKNATQQVSELVAAVQRNTDEGLELSAVVLDKMVTSVAKVTDLVLDVAMLIEEQGTGAEQILKSADRMQTRTQEMASELEHQARDARKLLDGVALVRHMTQQVATASGEQKQGADQVVKAIEDIARVARQNLSANEELAHSTSSLKEEARRLKRTAGAFEL